MKFNIGALALAVGLFWGGAILLVGVSNLIWPGYGQAFLQLAASMYPGYRAGATFGQVVIGTLTDWWTERSAEQYSRGFITGSRRSSAQPREPGRRCTLTTGF